MYISGQNKEFILLEPPRLLSRKLLLVIHTHNTIWLWRKRKWGGLQNGWGDLGAWALCVYCCERPLLALHFCAKWCRMWLVQWFLAKLDCPWEPASLVYNSDLKCHFISTEKWVFLEIIVSGARVLGLLMNILHVYVSYTFHTLKNSFITWHGSQYRKAKERFTHSESSIVKAGNNYGQQCRGGVIPKLADCSRLSSHLASRDSPTWFWECREAVDSAVFLFCLCEHQPTVLHQCTHYDITLWTNNLWSKKLWESLAKENATDIHGLRCLESKLLSKQFLGP